MPSITPVSGVSGVVGTLAEVRPPAWSMTTSVKVPPTSTPMRQAVLSVFMAIRSRSLANPVLMAEAEYPSLFFNDQRGVRPRLRSHAPFEQWRKAVPPVQPRKCRCIDADLGAVEDFSIAPARRNLFPEKRGVDFREHERRFAGIGRPATGYRRARPCRGRRCAGPPAAVSRPAAPQAPASRRSPHKPIARRSWPPSPACRRYGVPPGVCSRQVRSCARTGICG